jgi:hypothetical protein
MVAWDLPPQPFPPGYYAALDWDTIRIEDGEMKISSRAPGHGAADDIERSSFEVTNGRGMSWLEVVRSAG